MPELHMVEVPADASADFVRDFLRDVQLMLHGSVQADDTPSAAIDDPVEVIDPVDDPEDSPAEWLPGDWVSDRPPRTKRGRRRAERVRTLPVVRAPRLPRRRRVVERPERTGRLVRAGLVVVLIGACGALPWVAPQVPDWFANAIPEKSRNVVVDPPVTSPTPFPGVTVAPLKGFTGRRLQSAGKPLEVRVERLRVSSPVLPISGQSGALVPPNDPQELGWWQEGRDVGAESGTAVVTGHTVHTGGGAFDHLGKLVTGDRIRVRTRAGWITYAVQVSRNYSVQALARDAKKIFRLSGPGRLVLITCSDFNGVVYLSNAVVTATPIRDQPFKPVAGPTSGATPDTGFGVPDGGLGQVGSSAAGNTGDARGVQPADEPS